MGNKIDKRKLAQRWLHSHEEDSEGNQVYRPADFPFPPSRGRDGFELRADGTLVDRGIGPTDRPQKTEGTWKLEDDGTLVFDVGSPTELARRLTIGSVEKDRLVLKKRKAK